MSLVSYGKLPRVWRVVVIGFWAHLPPIFILALLFLASMIFLDDQDARITFRAASTIKSLFGFLPTLMLIGGSVCAIWLLLIRSRLHTMINVLRWLKGRNWLEILLLRVPLVFIIMSLVTNLVLNFKINIPKFNPYSWDHFFAEIDRLLFFGIDPWILTHTALNNFEYTKLIDNFYVIWFIVQQFGILYVGCLPLRDRVRLTFLIAFCLNWVIGAVVLAIMLPAAGPVYMEALYGDPMFRPLTDLLHQQSSIVELKAVVLQELLWDGLTKPDVDPLGISAFPSLHVAAAVNFACLSFAVNRTAGWLLSAFAGIIMIGSVHLGWHYAVDGFAGIILAVLFWHISARVARWWLARTEPCAAREAAAV